MKQPKGALPKSVGIYARISNDSAGEALGVQRQEKACRDWAQANGWIVTTAYIENSVSAWNRRKKRPQWLAMLKAIKTGEIDGVLATAVDRLARRPMDLEALFAAADEAGIITVRTLDGGLDMANPSGLLTARMMAAIAAEESRVKSDRLKGKAVQLAASGGVSGGSPNRPYGYTSDKLKIVPKEAKVIRELAERYLAGESLSSLVRWLNTKPIPSESGKQWSHQVLRRMLGSARIAGKREHHGVVVADAVWPAIITFEQHLAIRERFAEQAANKSVRAPRKYLLSGGILVCGECGGKMVSHLKSAGVEQRRYICRKDPNTTNCGRRAQLADPLEEFVLKACQEALRGLSAPQAPVDAQPELTALQAELEAVGERKSLLATEFARGSIGAQEWAAARAVVEERETELRGAITELTAPAQGLEWLGKSSIVEDWDKQTFEQRKILVHTLIDRVVLGPVIKGKNTFTPQRVRIAWKV